MTDAPHTGGTGPTYAYPEQYKKETSTKLGKTLLRPIRPDDDAQLMRLYKTFSVETIYHRFFSYVNATPDRVKRMTHIDYRRQMAIVAEVEIAGVPEIVGVARYNTPEGGSPVEAEMAIVVGDPYQGNGVGAELLDTLIKVARAEGFNLLFGIVHYDNKPAQRLFEKVQAPHRIKDNGSEWNYEVDLRPKAG